MLLVSGGGLFAYLLQVGVFFVVAHFRRAPGARYRFGCYCLGGVQVLGLVYPAETVILLDLLAQLLSKRLLLLHLRLEQIKTGLTTLNRILHTRGVSLDFRSLEHRDGRLYLRSELGLGELTSFRFHHV